MVFLRTSRARGLSRQPSCSGTVQTTIVLRDCLDHHRARGLSRPPSCSGTVSTTLTLGDCPDHSPNIAWRLLSSATCDLYSHIVERHLFGPCYKADTFTFQQARGLHRYDAPVGASRIACTTIGFSTLVRILFRPWHHVPTSPTTRLGD